jgi:radical SAM protein with 4Fe4S-binding SPASM domain
MTRHWEFDLFGGTVAEGWDSFKAIKDKKSSLQHCCSDCEAIAVCSYCPGEFYLENGDDDRPSEYICSVGKMRYYALQEK